MRHLSQQMLSEEMKRPYLKKRRRLLQRQLRSPSVDPEQKRRIQNDLLRLGEPKIYSADDPPPFGALDPGPMPIKPLEISLEATYESLSIMPHTRLYLFAIQKDLPIHPGNTKAQIVTEILRFLRDQPGAKQ